MNSELFVRRSGSGDPVVYLHGLGASSRYFERLWAQLPPHRIIAPDLLGFGRSPKPWRNAYRLEDHLDALAPLVPAGAPLVGHSVGAVLTAALAQRLDSQPRVIALLGLPAFPAADNALESIAGLGPLARGTVEGRIGARAACAAMCAFRPLARWLAPRMRPDLPASVAADLVDHTWRSYTHSLRHLVVEHRVADGLAHGGISTVLIHGRDDRAAPLDHVRALLANGVTADLEVLPGDHQLPLHHPDRLSRVLVRHLWPAVRF
ncbi:alpha/beta fold hydrolase [Glycomyces tenuis]|uniref:alpha/beta fold hydrolase n=1 Tax=Glycomyces tenuis TaxID=58116 RepID=UPI0004238C23|nr:alpha/beta hydrolase [Glycomyces tenuis]